MRKSVPLKLSGTFFFGLNLEIDDSFGSLMHKNFIV